VSETASAAKDGAINALESAGVDIKKVVEITDRSIDAVKSAADSVSETASAAAGATKEGAINALEAAGVDTKKVAEITDRSLDAVKSAATTVGDAAVDLGKDASGYNAYHNRQKANAIKDRSEAKLDKAQKHVEACRVQLNDKLAAFGKKRNELLVSTLGRFLDYIKAMGQRFKEKEFEIPEGCDLSPYELKEMGNLEMNAQDILKTTATTTTVASAALCGVPWAVTHGVMAIGAASTGTAISSLSGAAATNATLAWLGGGSLASGGGGIAAGTAVLGGLTVGITGVAALATAGFIASKHYEKKLTEAVNYEAEVDKACAQMDLACDFMGQMERRIEEMDDVTMQICKRADHSLDLLEPLVQDFSIANPHDMKVFQQNALLMKSVSELVKTPIIDEEGNLSEAGSQVMMKSRKLLNTQLS